MKKSLLALAALTFMVWGCSSDDSDSGNQPVPPQPSQQEIPAGTDSKPTWSVPNYDLYEQTMYVEVQLQDTLVKYASDQDLMCATVGTEVRAVGAARMVSGQWLFPLTIASNDAGIMVGLQYYCDKLHRIFTIETWARFDATAAPTGRGGIYTPTFVK